MKFGAMNNPVEPLGPQIDLFARMGFDFLDLTVEEPAAGPHRDDWPQLKRMLDDSGLGVVGHTGPYLPIASPSRRVRQTAWEELRSSVDIASFMGARVCTMHFLRWPDFVPFEDGVGMYVEGLSALTAHGRDRGVRIAIENSPRNEHQLKPLREILHRVPGLGLLYDIGHGNIQTQKPLTEDYLFDLGDRLVHVHLSDNNGQEDCHLPPGTPKSGGLNVPREFRKLRNFNYDGTVTLEVFGQRMWLAASLDYVRQVVASLS